MKINIKNIIKEELQSIITEAKLPKRFTVKTRKSIDGTVYSPGDYALKKKRSGGGIYLNMDKGEMLGVDAANISQLTEAKSLKQYSDKQLLALYKQETGEALLQAIEKELKNRKVKFEGKLDERIKSNIKQKWDSSRTMMDDLRQFILQAKDAGGSDLVRDIADALKLMTNYAMGEYKKAKSLREGRLDEKFASKKIASLFGKVGKWGKDKTFLDDMARQYGVQWDQLTDDMVKGPDTRIDSKGIDIVIASKDVEIPASSTYDWRTRIGAGQLLAVTIKGKRVWIGRGIRTGAGSGRAFIGLDKRGFASIKDVMKIDGAQVYHLDPDEAARGAKQKIKDREAAKAGATAMMDAKKVKQDNIARYRKALTIKAGKAGKGAIVKMLEQITKMYEAAINEKLTKMKQGFIPRDSYYADTVKTIGHRYNYMIRAFEEYMRAGANIEAVKAKYKDKPDQMKYSIDYETSAMANKAKEVKDEFNKLKMELTKLDKAKAYVDVKTLGRAY